MQASIARLKKFSSVHVALPQVHNEKDDFASSNATKHVIHEPVRDQRRQSKAVKPQSYSAEKLRPFRK